MINAIVVFDNDDETLGVFFEHCATISIKEMNKVHEGFCNIQEINSRALNELNIELKTSQIKGNFIFISFTHGSQTALLSGNTPFIRSSNEKNHLANSFSYCFACHSGKTLGGELVKTGTYSFIGYSKSVDLAIGYLEKFAECAVEGLYSFFNGSSILDSYKRKLIKYNNEIDMLYKENFFAASVLMDNRDCLVLIGDGNLMINDFR